MKFILLGIIAIIGAVSGLILFSQSEPAKSEVNSSQELSMQKISDDVALGGQLLDVRTPDEYTAGYIYGAINLPLQDIQAGQVPKADLDSPVYVYCRSGNRSNQAKKILEGEGFTNVIDLGSVENVQSKGGKLKSS